MNMNPAPTRSATYNPPPPPYPLSFFPLIKLFVTPLVLVINPNLFLKVKVARKRQHQGLKNRIKQPVHHRVAPAIHNRVRVFPDNVVSLVNVGGEDDVEVLKEPDELVGAARHVGVGVKSLRHGSQKHEREEKYVGAVVLKN